ncbi:deaminase [Streptomyces lancefieldiae]|uniref:Deaminase n=1 Tax=Streptomyces lancefieldiae TaxID=3075520 RepID=A0ABU3AKS1_9ACTN|nr:deaminase [Streptomyces sp. DSM 40712]MDT0610455.1 deaminase [Streptomyces sp. DSM 40712]
MSTSSRERDLHWMRRAVELARLCPPSEGAYSVGAVVVGADGRELASGYSRENGGREHAEQAALAKLPSDDVRLRTATIYSTLEPCSRRSHSAISCAHRILAAGLPRVVIAWREPSLFVADCVGCELLTEAGVRVVELPELAADARAVNAHLGRLDQSKG